MASEKVTSLSAAEADAVPSPSVEEGLVVSVQADENAAPVNPQLYEKTVKGDEGNKLAVHNQPTPEQVFNS